MAEQVVTDNRAQRLDVWPSVLSWLAMTWVVVLCVSTSFRILGGYAPDWLIYAFNIVVFSTLGLSLLYVIVGWVLRAPILRATPQGLQIREGLGLSEPIPWSEVRAIRREPGILIPTMLVIFRNGQAISSLHQSGLLQRSGALCRREQDDITLEVNSVTPRIDATMAKLDSMRRQYS